MTHAEIVSNEGEPLILVNDQDAETGFLDKASCHDGEGLLHRAFSLFLFNAKGDVLIQQRVEDKRLWPMFWSNSCCSHPRQSESMEVAVERRLQEELGIQAQMHFLYKFQYHAKYLDLGSERELCSVFAGRVDDRLDINIHEIHAWKWVSSEQLDQLLAQSPDTFTPWLKMEWKQLREDFKSEIDSIIAL